MDYRIIRVSDDYSVVVLVSPANADPLQKDKLSSYTYYLHHYREWVEERQFFLEVPAGKALGFFGGLADGLGFGDIPEEPFLSLAEAEQWVRQRSHWI